MLSIFRRISGENRPEAAPLILCNTNHNIDGQLFEMLLCCSFLSSLLRWKVGLLTRLYDHSITTIEFSSFGGTVGKGKRGGTIDQRVHGSGTVACLVFPLIIMLRISQYWILSGWRWLCCARRITGTLHYSTCTWLCYFSRIAVATTQRSHNVAPKLDAEPMNRWTDESMNRWSDESMKRWIDESMKRWLFFGSHIIFNIKFLGEQKWKIDTIFIKIIVSAQIGGLAGPISSVCIHVLYVSLSYEYVP